MFARRLRVRLGCPQSPAAQYPCPVVAASRFSSSSSSPPSSDQPPPQPRLYEKLFGGKSAPKSRPSRTRSNVPRPQKHEEEEQEEPAPAGLGLGDELRHWFQDVAKEEEERIAREDPPVVVVLQNAPRLLLESDFYRLAHHGQHVGWAAGITQVIQHRSATTGDAKGQYFLHFDSRSAAAAYLDKVKRLHRLAAASVPPSFAGGGPGHGQEPTSSHTGDEPPASAAPRDAAALDAWTMLPPTAPLRYTVMTHRSLRDVAKRAAAAAAASTSSSSSSAATSAGDPAGRGNPGRGRERDRERERDGWLGSVLSLLPGPSRPPGRFASPAGADAGPSSSSSSSYQVLVRLSGSKLTVRALLGAIRDDEVRRNLRWGLLADNSMAQQQQQQQEAGEGKAERRASSCRPVTALRAGSSRIEWSEQDRGRSGEAEEEEGEDGMASTTRRERVAFSRFVLTFPRAADAHRFARAWHLRRMVDERTGRDVVLSTSLPMVS